LEWLERHEDAVIDWIPVDDVGRMDLAALEAAMGQDVALVTTLLANNEVGTVQPVAEIVRIAGEVPVHCDAVGAWGQVPLPAGLAAISVSAHKLGGPVGIGALALARGTTVTPLIHGGNQQPSRSGTQDAAAAAAFAAATALPHADLAPLRDRLIAGVRAAVPEAVLRGDPVDRLPGNVHFTFPGCEGDSLLFLLDAAGISVSTGSACQAGVPEASHVLLAMGLDEPTARGALRFTLGHGSTAADVDALLAALPHAVERARSAGLV
ncbi:MAG: aminotransferase class V-fold PLP-dependent enzyme, partial [Rhodoglobus sp.]